MRPGSVAWLARHEFKLAWGDLAGQAQTETSGDPTALTALGYTLRATATPTTSLDFVPNCARDAPLRVLGGAVGLGNLAFAIRRRGFHGEGLSEF